MLRRTLESAYGKTIGAVGNAVTRFVQSGPNRSNWVEVLYVVGVVLFMAGGVSAFFFPVADQSYIIYPAGGAQSISETVIDACVILLGGAGVYATYVSGRQTTKPRMVNLYLALALLLIALSVLLGIFVSDLKG